jgi:exopolysaccharide biosynthesis protein
MLKAPRTAVGLKQDGSIFIAVVDGVELLKEGLDLYEWAEILIEKGAVQAINLDGGGSTDAFLNGNIWNLPNCDDKPNSVCERPVTTITCLKYPKKDEFLAY